MALKVGDSDVLINDSVATGLQCWLLIKSAFGDATLRVARWSRSAKGWAALGDITEEGKEARVTVTQAGASWGELLDKDTEAVSIQVESGDELTQVAVAIVNTPTRAK